jgi:hypothetical protein
MWLKVREMLFPKISQECLNAEDFHITKKSKAPTPMPKSDAFGETLTMKITGLVRWGWTLLARIEPQRLVGFLDLRPASHQNLHW